MKSLAFVFPLAAGALLCAQSPEWDKAMAHAKQQLAKANGTACLVLLERVDATTVKIRLQVLGTSIREASFTGIGESISVRALELDSPKGMDHLQGSAMLNEQIHTMDIQLKGEDFRPRIRMRVPKQGDKPETGLVVVGSALPK
jgi:hypothetical protein